MATNPPHPLHHLHPWTTLHMFCLCFPGWLLSGSVPILRLSRASRRSLWSERLLEERRTVGERSGELLRTTSCVHGTRCPLSHMCASAPQCTGFLAPPPPLPLPPPPPTNTKLHSPSLDLKTVSFLHWVCNVMNSNTHTLTTFAQHTHTNTQHKTCWFYWCCKPVFPPQDFFYQHRKMWHFRTGCWLVLLACLRVGDTLECTKTHTHTHTHR